jgi:eukaryotic-like serine/threonine-protein kinase
MAPSPGDTIGPYRIVARLGEGAMGWVLRAVDTRSDHEVALKVLQNENVDARRRILREARAAASLDHPNVVRVHDVGEAEGIAYLAMELVDGDNLRRFVADQGVSLSERIRWLRDVARGLSAAHARRIVHRDVKPENVMITRSGRIKVCDFGIARSAPRPVTASSTTDAQILSTETGTGAKTAGTPRYMAPEHMRGDPPDPRNDQFSWGVMAYELLTGRFPWGNQMDALQLVAALLTKDPDPLPTSVPPHVASVVLRTLHKDPALRFGSMNDVVAALEEAPRELDGLRVVVPEVGGHRALERQERPEPHGGGVV